MITLAEYEYNAIIQMLATVKTREDRIALLEMWLNEKAVEAYKQGWKDCCAEYDIEYGDEDEEYEDEE